MNNFTYIEPATNTSTVYVSLIFRYGFYTEKNNKFGAIHLLEHYTTALLNRKYPAMRVYASVDNLYFRITLVSDKGSVTTDLENIIHFLKNELDLDSELLENEKNRIKVEFIEKYYDFHEYLKDEIKSGFLLDNQPVIRKNSKQIKTIDKVEFSDLIKTKDDMQTKDNMHLFMMSDPETKDSTHSLIKRLITEFSEKKPKPILLKKANFVPGFHLSKKHSIVTRNNNYLTLIFEGLPLDADISDRYALVMILEEIEKRLKFEVENLGGYYFNYRNISSKYYSLIYFYTQIPQHENDNFRKLLFATLDNVLNDKELATSLSKFKEKKITELESDWNNNWEKFDWAINDTLDFERVISMEEMKSKINSITPEILRKVSYILNLKTCSTLVLTR